MKKMKKLALAIGLCLAGTAVQAQDIIITRSGEEIKAGIIEVSAGTVKYQTNGQLSELPRSEVFLIMIKSDVAPEAQAPQPQPQQAQPQQAQPAYVQPQPQPTYVQPQQTYAPQQQTYAQQPQQTYPQPQDRQPTDIRSLKFNPGRFGLDYGIGSMNFGGRSDSYFGQDFAMNYTRMFIPYVGWNVFDLRASLIKNGYISEPEDQTRFSSLQLMTGLRGVVPLMVKNDVAIISPFVALKMGYGVFLNDPDRNVPGGFALDISIGVEFFSHAYLAFAYNLQNLSKDLAEGGKMDGEVNYYSFRLGYQF
jgi:hypothetical protein